MPESKIVHRSPEVLAGTPVFVGTRVPVRVLLEYLEAGDSLNEFLHDFPSVDRDQTIAFLEDSAEALLETQT